MPLPGGTGLGKPLKSIVRPLRTDIPIYLGAEGLMTYRIDDVIHEVYPPREAA